MNGKQFIKNVKGKQVDVDKYPASQPYQCVDLVKMFIRDVLDVQPQSIGNAIDYWKKRNSKYITDNFYIFKNTSTFVPKPFDIVIFDRGKSGHIAICTGDGDIKRFNVWQQNYPKRADPVNEDVWSYEQVAGFLRPKSQSKIFANSFFTPNAKITKATLVYSDNERTDPIGQVFENELVKAFIISQSNSVIEYATDVGYKVGIISSKNIKKL